MPLITRWPTLKQVNRARRSALQRFFSEHRVRRPNLTEARIRAIQEATALTDDPAVINPCKLEALAIAEQLRTTIELIKQFDEAIAELAPSMPDYPLFASLPGAGLVFTPSSNGPPKQSTVHPGPASTTSSRLFNNGVPIWFFDKLLD